MIELPINEQVRSTNSWHESNFFYFVALFACFSLFVFLHFFSLFAVFLFLCINSWRRRVIFGILSIFVFDDSLTFFIRTSMQNLESVAQKMSELCSI